MLLKRFAREQIKTSASQEAHARSTPSSLHGPTGSLGCSRGADRGGRHRRLLRMAGRTGRGAPWADRRRARARDERRNPSTTTSMSTGSRAETISSRSARSGFAIRSRWSIRTTSSTCPVYYTQSMTAGLAYASPSRRGGDHRPRRRPHRLVPSQIGARTEDDRGRARSRSGADRRPLFQCQT